MSSGAYTSWYAEEPSLKEKSNGVVDVNESTAATCTGLAIMAATAVARSANTATRAAFAMVAFVIFLDGVREQSSRTCWSWDLCNLANTCISR